MTPDHPRVRADWIEDPAGLRFIRRGLVPAVGGVTSLFLGVGILLDRGDTTLYLVLIGLAAAQVGLALAVTRLGRRIPGPQQLRIILATTPATLFLLGMAGWSDAHGTYFPVVPAVIAGTLATVLALTEPIWVLAPWAAVSCAALLAGAYMRTGGTPGILLPAIYLAGQAAIAWLIRDGIQRYHADRRSIVHEMAGLVPLATPQDTGAAIVALVRAWGGFGSVALLRFSGLGETTVIGASEEGTDDCGSARLCRPRAATSSEGRRRTGPG